MTKFTKKTATPKDPKLTAMGFTNQTFSSIRKKKVGTKSAKITPGTTGNRFAALRDKYDDDSYAGKLVYGSSAEEDEMEWESEENGSGEEDKVAKDKRTRRREARRRKKAKGKTAKEGNGAASSIYTIVTGPVYEMLEAQGYHATFRAAISGREVKFYGTIFVDDGDVVRNEPHHKSSLRDIRDHAK